MHVATIWFESPMVSYEAFPNHLEIILVVPCWHGPPSCRTSGLWTDMCSGKPKNKLMRLGLPHLGFVKGVSHCSRLASGYCKSYQIYAMAWGHLKAKLEHAGNISIWCLHVWLGCPEHILVSCFVWQARGLESACPRILRDRRKVLSQRVMASFCASNSAN